MQMLWASHILSLEKEEMVRYFVRSINKRQTGGPGAFKFLVSVPGQGLWVLGSIRWFINIPPPFVPSHQINNGSLLCKSS